jgi:phage-related baseplate assembly protein
MRLGLALLFTLIALAPARAQDTVRVELNTLETAENRCRMTFVIENKTARAVDSLKLDLALFNTEGAVYRRMVTDMGPVRAAKTVVKTFATDGDCAQLGSLLVNEVAACTPGEPNACLDQLALSSRVKAVRLYK